MEKKALALAILTMALMNSLAQAQSTTSAATATPADQAVEGTRSDLAAERLQLAISSIDYPVTPGDIYQLSYRETAGSIVTRQFQVDGISLLDLGVFGKIYALNMQFYQLKQNVENLISRNYTYSTPSLSIIAPGVFRVAIRDGSSQTRYVTAWGLSRISDIVLLVDSPSSSIRNIERITREGKSEHFDLLTETSTSLEGGDPFVRPGDTIVLRRAERTVELQGEVLRPGRYELVGDEGIRDLIEVFGKGATRKADLERLRITRATDTGERIDYVSFKQSYEANSKLNDGDIIVVGDRMSKRALVWFEGAVAPMAEDRLAAPGGARAEAAPQTAVNGRFSHPISEGVILSDVLQEIQDSVLPSADLGAVLLTRPGIPGSVVIDVRPLLSGSDLSTDLILLPDSTVFFPLLRSSVSVAGAVIQPGFVPYLPGAPASYYISLCGGINPDLNSFRAYTVRDQFGRRRGRKQAILPGDNIFVKNNDLSYVMERSMAAYAPLITAVVTALTFGISIGLLDISF